VLCTREVPLEQTRAYGVAKTNSRHELEFIVEKPEPKDAPSRQAIVGRYVFTPHLFNHLRLQTPGRNGEIQLTDSIAALLNDETISALPLVGDYFDCGDKMGYCMANFALACQHPEFGSSFRVYCQQYLAH
jgi:UTP--glucose-1-phosphate uridylyltransferase